MTIYVFVMLVKAQCLFTDPKVSATYKDNCMQFYVNCAIKGGTHVDEELYDSCKKRAKLCKFKTEGWLECKDRRPSE